MFEQIGSRVIAILEEIGEISILAGRTLMSIFKGRFKVKDVFTQMMRVGVDSVLVAVVTAAFVGGVFAIQISSEFIKYGAGSIVGAVLAIAVARELAPLLTAVVFSGRVGAAFAAEIGTMKVTEQIDAIYAMGSDPVKHLVVPRFLASTIMLPVLTIFADLVGFMGGYIVAVNVVGINPVGFMDSASMYLKTYDIVGGIIKAVFFGMIISLISCYRGMKATKGAKGVGEATTSSVVISLMSIFIINYFLSFMLFKK
ncbi:MlaE family ABC transporter permease [Candidatus Margulisiibacteriota bacterium]